MSAAQKSQEAKADDAVPEVKDGAQGPGEGQGNSDWTSKTGEFAAVGQDHVDREDRLKHHEQSAEEERKEERDGKVPVSRGAVAQKGKEQKAGQQSKARQLQASFGQTSFESTTARAQELKKHAELQKLQAPPPPRLSGGGNFGDAMKALHNAQEHGLFFKEEWGGANRPDEEVVDPELEAAIEECIRLLFGVQGILRVGPGVNELNEPVVIVVASRGFTAKSLQAVPQTVHRFKTLLALPFDLLPLRRERT